MHYREIFEQRGALYNRAHVIAPLARAAEGEAMLRWLALAPGETIMVAPAGGGFDAVTIDESLGGGACDGGSCAEIICVEPSERFSAQIPNLFPVHNCPLDDVPLEDETADAIVSLAGLHHVEERDKVFREWGRLLKPGGRIVIGDVEAGSANGEFLNTIVDRYTPDGHEGRFLEPGELTEAFHELGYDETTEELERYTWNFESWRNMLEFTRCLFGMTGASLEEIEAGIEQTLCLREFRDGGVGYDWSLRFFRGIKPHTRTPMLTSQNTSASVPRSE